VRERSAMTPDLDQPPLTRKRLLIVSGKGGVGKSTVAAALAVSAARRGLQTAIVEIAGRHDVASMLGAEPGGRLREVEVYPGLTHVTTERRPALEEYLRDELPGPLPAGVLARSRAFDAFVDATPGMGELLTIGKVWELAQNPRHKRGASPYELVVLDAPASGQLIGLLTAPRAFGTIARVGRVARQASAIERTLTDPRLTGVIVVATAEQMAVSEALGLRDLLAEEVGITPDAVVANQVFPLRLSARDDDRLRGAPDDPAVRSARWFYARTRAQQAELVRLRDGLGGAPLLELPFLFAAQLGRDDVEQIATVLERSLP
jgi:anion-transporting  ArsA/GET3 family ATPase